MHVEPSTPVVRVLGGLSLVSAGRRLPVPPGSRRLLAYLALHAFVFTFQSTALVIEWVGGSTTAFGDYPHAPKSERPRRHRKPHDAPVDAPVTNGTLYTKLIANAGRQGVRQSRRLQALRHTQDLWCPSCSGFQADR